SSDLSAGGRGDPHDEGSLGRDRAAAHQGDPRVQRDVRRPVGGARSCGGLTMAKVREIRRRIRSIENTRQITRTMEMVATSKLKRATERVAAARPYAQHLTAVIARLLDPELRERYPLLRRPETIRRAAVVLLTANRGLAGAFNANLIREARGLVGRLRQD